MKKLSDKLGFQWKKDELVRFYEAYRKYGKDWEKVCLFTSYFLPESWLFIGNLRAVVLVAIDLSHPCIDIV